MKLLDEREGEDLGDLRKRKKDEIVILGIGNVVGLRKVICLLSIIIKGLVEFGKVRVMNMIVCFFLVVFKCLVVCIE